MKKTLKYLLFLAVLLLPLKINASTLSVGLICPQGASPGQTISCTVTSSSSGDVNSVMATYSFSSGVIYANFTTSGFGLVNPKPTGFQVGQPGGAISSAVNLGTLYVVIPAGAAVGSKHTISLINIVGSNTSYEDLSAPNASATVTILSGNNYLSSLSIAGAAISFNKNTTSYNVTIDAPSTTITATAEDGRSSVSGAGYKNIAEGKNTYYITVTAQNGAKRTYTIVVNRPYSQQPTTPTPETPTEPTTPEDGGEEEEDEELDLPGLPNDELHEIGSPDKSNSNKLSSLKIDKIPFNFNPSIINYDLYVDYEIDEIKITAKAENSKATIDGAKSHKLIMGRNVVRVSVTAENGKVRVYEIVINRDKEEKITSKNQLKKLKIDGKEITLENKKNDYTVITSGNSLKLDLELSDEYSSYVVYGNTNLETGSKVRIKVTDEDGNINVYEVTVTVNDTLQTTKEKKSILPLIIIIIIAVIVVVETGFGIYLFIKNKKEKETNPFGNISTPTQPVDETPYSRL